MSIWKGEYKNVVLGWNSPVKYLVHPQHIRLEERTGLGFLDGFNEWIVRCGLSSFGSPGKYTIQDGTGEKREVMLPLHGRIANIPASTVEIRVKQKPPYELEVKGIMFESSMFGPNLKLTSSIKTNLRSNSLIISDTIENLSCTNSEIQLLYHCNYSSPFLEDGARLFAPIRSVASSNKIAAKNIDAFQAFGPPKRGFIEEVYYMQMLSDKKNHTKTILVNMKENRAVSMSFSTKSLPFFTLWENTASLKEGYVVGLEPATGFPNTKSFEKDKGRIRILQPKEKYQSKVTFTVHLGKKEVRKAIMEIEKIRGNSKPKIFYKPNELFSPV